jgi:hypothetical protein
MQPRFYRDYQQYNLLVIYLAKEISSAKYYILIKINSLLGW